MRDLLKVLLFTLCIEAVKSISCPTTPGGTDIYLENNGLQCVSNCGSQYINNSGTQCTFNCVNGEAAILLNGITQCKQCYPKYVNLSGDQCVADCAETEIFDSSSNKCNNCPGGEYISLDGKNCISSCDSNEESVDVDQFLICSCPVVYKLDGNACNVGCQKGEAKISYKHSKRCTSCSPKIVSYDELSCVDSCRVGEAFDTGEQRCILCSEQPGQDILSFDGKTCTNTCDNGVIFIDNLGNKKCIQCFGPANKINSSGNSCVSNCSAGEVVRTQANFIQCQICKSQIVSSDGLSCVNECNVGEVAVQKTNQCTACSSSIPNCQICQSENFCKECNSHYILKNGQCISTSSYSSNDIKTIGQISSKASQIIVVTSIGASLITSFSQPNCQILFQMISTQKVFLMLLVDQSIPKLIESFLLGISGNLLNFK